MIDKNLKALESKLAVVPSFISLGMKLGNVEHRPGIEVLGESFVFNYANSDMRAIQVIYHPRSNDKGYFLVNLVNTENNDVFNLEDWLKKHKLLEQPDPFRLLSHPGSTVDKMDSFMTYLDLLLQKEDLKCILQGKTWELVAFNWAGMK